MIALSPITIHYFAGKPLEERFVELNTAIEKSKDILSLSVVFDKFTQDELDLIQRKILTVDNSAVKSDLRSIISVKEMLDEASTAVFHEDENIMVTKEDLEYYGYFDQSPINPPVTTGL